jgi:hypothetical protein
MYPIDGSTVVIEPPGRRKAIRPPSHSRLSGEDARRGLYEVFMKALCMYRETLLRR